LASLITKPKRKANHFENDLVWSFGKKVFSKYALEFVA